MSKQIPTTIHDPVTTTTTTTTPMWTTSTTTAVTTITTTTTKPILIIVAVDVTSSVVSEIQREENLKAALKSFIEGTIDPKYEEEIIRTAEQNVLLYGYAFGDTRKRNNFLYFLGNKVDFISEITDLFEKEPVGTDTLLKNKEKYYKQINDLANKNMPGDCDIDFAMQYILDKFRNRFDNYSQVYYLILSDGICKVKQEQINCIKNAQELKKQNVIIITGLIQAQAQAKDSILSFTKPLPPKEQDALDLMITLATSRNERPEHPLLRMESNKKLSILDQAEFLSEFFFWANSTTKITKIVKILREYNYIKNIESKDLQDLKDVLIKREQNTVDFGKLCSFNYSSLYHYKNIKLLGIGSAGMTFSTTLDYTLLNQNNLMSKSLALKALFNFNGNVLDHVGEYYVLSRLKQHPNVVQIYCHFREQFSQEIVETAIKSGVYPKLLFNEWGNAFSTIIVMELIPLTLNEFCSGFVGQIPRKKILLICYQICSALLWLWEQNIVHCDIKHDNILIQMLDDLPIPVLIDFGTCVVVNSNGFGPSTSGNTRHRAPELRAVNSSNALVDYSKQPAFELGVISLEIATKASFSVEEIDNQSVVKLALQQTDLGENFCEMVLNLVHPNPVQRWELSKANELLINLLQ